ncbi:MAG: hypothetical protein HQ547_08115 [Candidatus Omnitrophica bacterium]|nr:hypothetical protein [Candidatus Omnitrophota bacterium]
MNPKIKKIITKEVVIILWVIFISGALISIPFFYREIGSLLLKMKVQGKEYVQFLEAKPLINSLGNYGFILLALGYPISLLIRFISRAVKTGCPHRRIEKPLDKT